MKIKTGILILFLVVSFSLSAQEQEKKERIIKYSIITEAGIVSANPKEISVDATVVNGFSINKQHLIGLGIGYGTGFGDGFRSISYNSSYSYTMSYYADYIPIFVNYRLYFKPDKKFSPHINVSVGGIATEETGGVYSSIAMGFRSEKFSFSSGVSFMTTHQIDWFETYDNFTYNISPKRTLRYHLGITLKAGFTF